MVGAHPETINQWSARFTMACWFFRCREFALSTLARRREHPQRGQAMIEYALILVLISVVVVAIVSLTGKHVNNLFSNISHDLGNLSTAAAKHKKHK